MPVSAQYLIINVLMYCDDSMLSSVLSQSHIIQGQRNRSGCSGFGWTNI